MTLKMNKNKIANQKKILLHTCCAPCALPIIEYFKQTKLLDEVLLYFFNPNIFPREEYQKRKSAVAEISKIYDLPFLEGEDDHNKWLNFLKGSLKDAPETYLENSDRCLQCFYYRLDSSIVYAKKHQFLYFASTLQVNLYKNTTFIIQTARELCRNYNINFLDLPLDSYLSHKNSIELAKKYGIYRQKYCGCEFSLGAD